MKQLLITSEILDGMVKALRSDLPGHLASLSEISVAGEIEVARALLAKVDHSDALVLSEENEILMWALAQAALTACLIGFADRGVNISASDVN